MPKRPAQPTLNAPKTLRIIGQSMNNRKQGIGFVAALLGGFLLSFVGMGVLWVGTPVPYQFLMFFPFLLLAVALRRFGWSALPMLLGLIPIGEIFVQFRDRDDSHLTSILLVAAWVSGILLGHYLGGRLARHPRGTPGRSR
jgi:hypothetical protein